MLPAQGGRSEPVEDCPCKFTPLPTVLARWLLLNLPRVGVLQTCFPSLSLHRAAGSHFGTAKELAEEIRSLASEREGLEGLLHQLSVLSSRNLRKLGSVREDYSRLRRDLDHGKTAHGKKSQVLPGDICMRFVVWLGQAGPSGLHVDITWTCRAGQPGAHHTSG